MALTLRPAGRAGDGEIARAFLVPRRRWHSASCGPKKALVGQSMSCRRLTNGPERLDADAGGGLPDLQPGPCRCAHRALRRSAAPGAATAAPAARRGGEVQAWRPCWRSGLAPASAVWMPKASPMLLLEQGPPPLGPAAHPPWPGRAGPGPSRLSEGPLAPAPTQIRRGRRHARAARAEVTDRRATICGRL